MAQDCDPGEFHFILWQMCFAVTPTFLFQAWYLTVELVFLEDAGSYELLLVVIPTFVAIKRAGRSFLFQKTLTFSIISNVFNKIVYRGETSLNLFWSYEKTPLIFDFQFIISSWFISISYNWWNITIYANIKIWTLCY